MNRCVAALAFVVAASACVDETATSVDHQPQFAQVAQSEAAAAIATYMDDLNAALTGEGADYRVAMAEYLTDGASQEAGQTVLAKDVGNKRLDFQFVPGDPRRFWSGPEAKSITYAIDRTSDAVPPFGGLTGAETDAAIVRAMNTWDALTCSDLGLARNPDFGADIGLVAFIISGALVGSPFVFADVQHAGWRDLNFGGGILGVAFTFRFIDADGNSTDIDGDGYFDAAFREIYYDPSFPWADDGSSNVDVETVAVHEAGHGLSQGHFGRVAINNKTGALKVSPRAVMNALYTGPYRDLAGTDNGGHCASWGNWPHGRPLR
jgi:hypothetical protein